MPGGYQGYGSSPMGNNPGYYQMNRGSGRGGIHQQQNRGGAGMYNMGSGVSGDDDGF